MVTLNDLKMKRTSEKRKVGTSYNNIINRLTLGNGAYDEELVDMMKRLSHEFNSFTTAYHAYSDGLDKEGAYAEEKTQCWYLKGRSASKNQDKIENMNTSSICKWAQNVRST